MAKKSKSKPAESAEAPMEDRFAAAETRPQFRPLRKDQSKVVLDDRFSSVLTDARFQLEGKDKYGRKKKQAVKEDLSAFYTIEDGTERQDDPAKEDSETDDESQASGSDGKADDPASRIAYLRALSRGELATSSSSEEDESSESSDEDDEEEDPVHGTAGVLDPSNKEEIEISYDASPYLVATNMDWEHVRAVDLFSILSSFTPPGSVKKVQVYASDFGMERMSKDRLLGPADIWKKKKSAKSSSAAEEVQRLREEGSESSDESENDDSESEDEEIEEEDQELVEPEGEAAVDESDFDAEKLRAYEASKLKYYFAVVEFSNPEYADIAYREVDGMEFEHSSSAIDLRTLPPEEVEGVVTDRPLRDEAAAVPSNYEPPEFILSALQQTNVQCTWDQGDVERERKLTKYGTGGWQDMAEADDLKAYMASDQSSDEGSDGEHATKSSDLRKMLGLDGGDSDDDESDKSESHDSDSSSNEEEGGKVMKFIPGAKSLEEKIRSKLESKDDEKEELTPWQKYQEKRKQKRRERRQVARERRRGGTEEQDESESDEAADEDEFFMDESKGGRKNRGNKQPKKDKDADMKDANTELELLLAGDNEEEEARDYDIRGLERMEKNKDKKLRGSRKRKEAKLSANVAGKDFQVDVNDNRFAAVLDGADDRFGIDKTDPNFKQTAGMKDILVEQTKRRKKKRRKTDHKGDNAVVPNVNADNNEKSAGASALSALVKRLKTKVSTGTQ